MKRFTKALAAIMLMMAVVFAAGCTPENDPINGGGNNGNNNENQLPVITTSQVSDINSTSVNGGGVITSSAGTEVTERGLCWGTQPNPDVSGTHATAGTGVGTFSCEITDLLPNTTYHVRAYAINGIGVGYGSDIAFTTLEHGYVDLGLPSGTLWAVCNVGANTPEGYGDYFAWGETEPKSVYNWSTYKYCENGSYSGISHQLTKYCSDSEWGYNGFTDYLTILQPMDDGAVVNWGDAWRTPTNDEWDELIAYCICTWTVQNGINGRCFTAQNGNSIFLPAAASRWNEGYENTVGQKGFYWSNTRNSDEQPKSWVLTFEEDLCETYGRIERAAGLSVRPVRSAN